MDFSDFRSRAIAEGRRYGKDDYVFVREFAQNARDAGASRISLVTESKTDGLEITFTDNGNGMPFEQARRFLFTLYASSKENEANSAGQFGVGFWSVLLFAPQRIIIYSKAGKENWGIEFDQTLETERRIVSPLQYNGTRILVYKPIPSNAIEQVVSDIEKALFRYCKYLRRNDRKARPLQVEFNGKRIDCPMKLDGECTASFQCRDVQGSVALGKSPHVSLYVRGLPVWTGTSLSELQYGARPEAPLSYPKGLAPVYLLDGNKLSVTLDRRSVFDDAALRRTRRIAQQQMRKLISRYLDNIAPPGWTGRIEYAVASLLGELRERSIKQLWPLFLTIGILLVVGIGAGQFFPEHISRQWLPESVNRLLFTNTKIGSVTGSSFADEYQRATIDEGVGSGLNMTYSPAALSPYFRTQVVEILDIHSGAKSGELAPYRVPASYVCKQDCIDVRVQLEGSEGVYYLPVQSGYYIDSGSIQLEKGTSGEVVRSAKDDWLFIQKASGRKTVTVKYTIGPAVTVLNSREKYLNVPPIRLPIAYAEAVQTASTFEGVEKRVTFLAGLVEQSILYDTSAKTVAQYQQFFHSTVSPNWYDFVFSLNRGDCDVKNIILITLLRKLKIPSRLAVGYVGKQGKIQAGKHAWVEYYIDGWKVVDATGQSFVSEATNDPGSLETSVEVASSLPEAAGGDDSSFFSTPQRSKKKDNSMPSSEPYFTGIPVRLLCIATGVIALLFLGAVWVLTWRRYTTLPIPSDEQEHLAAQLLQAAVENEKLHLPGSGLYSRKMIPTWNGPRISMKKVRKLSRAGILFYAGVENSLVAGLVARKCLVVSVQKAIFASIVSRMSGSMNLDELTHLRPVVLYTPTSDASVAHRIIFEAIEIARHLGLPQNSILPCRGLKGMLYREFCIAALPVPWKSDVPSDFVAVSLENEPAWGQLATVGHGIEGAAIALLESIFANALIFRGTRGDLMEKLMRIKSSKLSAPSKADGHNE